MKITIEYQETDENEVILRCPSLDDEMLHILSFLKAHLHKIVAFKERTELTLLSPSDILYCESVDDKVFVYCEADIFQTALNLLELETQYTNCGFFRISKSMVINLGSIQHLKSCASGKIKALLSNGETVIVSRHYAPLLREKLMS